MLETREVSRNAWIERHLPLEEHAIHRLHAFLPHLARRQPELLALLPLEERPGEGQTLMDWAVGLPQRRLLEICHAWVLESLSLLKIHSPLSNVLLRGCLMLSGEFDLGDAAAVAIGEVPPPGDPRREEIRTALMRAARVGVLIHLAREERYCLPFPVRLTFEGVDFAEPMERESIRLRVVERFATLAHQFVKEDEPGSPRHWRFPNMLVAYEMAVELMEELLGVEAPEWQRCGAEFRAVPELLVQPLLDFAEHLGQALVLRQSESVVRLLSASAAAARTNGDGSREADVMDLLGQFHLRRNEYPRAIEAYRRSELVRTELDERDGVVVAISAIALAHRQMGHPDLAVGEFLRACTYARGFGLHEAEIDTANCAARLLIELERAFETAQLLADVVESVRFVDRRFPAYAELLAQFGVALRMEGRIDESRDRLFAALGLARMHLHRPAEARVCLELGHLFEQVSELEESVKWIRRAKNLYIQVADYAGLAQTYLALARLGRAGQPDRDLEMCLSKALRCAQAAHDDALTAQVWHERGQRALDQGNRGTAIAHFCQEVGALRPTRFVERLVRAHILLAELYIGQEAFLAAGTEALRAQGLARAYLRDEPGVRLNEVLDRARAGLTPEQFDFLVQDVSDEMDEGRLKEE